MNDNKKLVYDINENPHKWHEWLLYAFQMLMAVFVATVLISNICGTPVDAGLLGACLGTLTYQLITRFKSPIFISNSGATVSAVIGALALGSTPNYFAVFIGGMIVAAIYAIFAFIVKWRGIEALNRLFPPYIVGPITIVIGANLAGFIPTYVDLGGINSNINVVVAIVVMLIIAAASHYFKGFLKTIPFLIGLLAGFIACLILELCGAANYNIIENFNHIDGFFNLPNFAFLHWSDGAKSFNWKTLLNVILLFTPVSVCALCEHYSDHVVMSNIIGHDLTKEPGLHRTLLGDGIASWVGTIFGGQPNTSYGESTATVGFSKVASVRVVSVAALMMGLLAFIEPIQVFLEAVPSCVFGGCAMILYGYIACSGLKTIMKNKVDLENNKKLIIVSVILTVGVSGIWLFSNSFAGVSLAMVLGIILNLLLKEKKD